jgi:hypothetical protein
LTMSDELQAMMSDPVVFGFVWWIVLACGIMWLTMRGRS